LPRQCLSRITERAWKTKANNIVALITKNTNCTHLNTSSNDTLVDQALSAPELREKQEPEVHPRGQTGLPVSGRA
jgi:hypothetical protein